MSSKGGSDSNAFYSQWTKNNYITSNHLASQAYRVSTANPKRKRKNLQGYTFGGITNIRKTKLYDEITGSQNPASHHMSSEAGFDSGREMLSGFYPPSQLTVNPGGGLTLERPTKPKVKNFFEQAYGADYKKQIKDRPMSCKSGYSRKSNVIERIKSYKAPNPYSASKNYFYKNYSNDQPQSKVSTKYEKKETDMRRFNENLSVTSKATSKRRNSRKDGVRRHNSSRRIFRDDMSSKQ